MTCNRHSVVLWWPRQYGIGRALCGHRKSRSPGGCRLQWLKRRRELQRDFDLGVIRRERTRPHMDPHWGRRFNFPMFTQDHRALAHVRRSPLYHATAASNAACATAMLESFRLLIPPLSLRSPCDVPPRPAQLAFHSPPCSTFGTASLIS